MKWMELDTIIEIHHRVITATGGEHGIRDKNLLQSALMAPLATFGGKDLYPDVLTKVAALLYGLTNNHPFIDGNKRTAFVVAITVLELNGYMFKATQEEVIKFMLEIAGSMRDIQATKSWLKKHSECALMPKGNLPM